MRLVLIVATLLVLGCGAPRTDPFVAPGPDASALDALDMDTNPCAAVEGQGCPCGALAGVWRCVGTMPVCVCPMPDAARTDASRDTGAMGRCTSDSDCNDAIVCTLDECIVGGVCEHTPVNNFCPTGQRCTVDRGCVATRVCANNADCNDNIQCTHDVCAASGACSNVRDDSVCTGGLRCSTTLGCVAPDAGTPDAGTPDGGTMRDELNTPRSGLMVRVLHSLVCPTCADEAVVDAAQPPYRCTCRTSIDEMSFSITTGAAEPLTISGSFHPRSMMDHSVRFADRGGVSFDADRVGLFSGTRVGNFQGFHVQFSAPYVAARHRGIGGVPGRTFAPDLGDLWLFGCSVTP